MDANPSRAKRRISARPSHGFCARLRRSTRCAVVSFPVFVFVLVVMLSVFFQIFAGKKKPTARCAGGGLMMSAYLKKKFLGQQPPRASAHACTTTTTAARRAKIGAT